MLFEVLVHVSEMDRMGIRILGGDCMASLPILDSFVLGVLTDSASMIFIYFSEMLVFSSGLLDACCFLGPFGCCAFWVAWCSSKTIHAIKDMLNFGVSSRQSKKGSEHRDRT